MGFSPDRNYLYYSSALRSEPNIFHVFQMPLLGGRPRRVATDTESWFSLSPDGASIVFACQRCDLFVRRLQRRANARDGARRANQRRGADQQLALGCGFRRREIA